MNINIEKKENPNSSLNNDNSYTELENVLYCSSPKRGIKFESNIKNKTYAFTPIISNQDMSTTHFTFNIFRDASTDIGSKEEMFNSQKSSNIISDFSISNLKNSKLNNTNSENKNNSSNNNNKDLSIKEETEGKKIIQEDEKRKRKKKVKNRYYSSKLDEFIFDQNKQKYKSERKKNNISENEFNKNKDKKNIIKNRKYEALNLKEGNLKKKSRNLKDMMHIDFDINFKKDNKKKTVKYQYYEDELIKDEKGKIKNKEKNQNLKDKREKIKSSIYFSKNFRYPSYSHELTENDYKKLKSNRKINNSNDNNFEDKNCISHPIKIDKDDKYFQNNILLIKSTKFVSQNQFPLLKEIDRDYENKTHREIKSAKKVYNYFRKKKKYNKKNHIEGTKKILFTDEKEKEISDFYDYKDKNEKKLKDTINKYFSNHLRKSNSKSDKSSENEIRKAKKSHKCVIKFNENKDKEIKIKSSMALDKNKKKTLKFKENHNKRIFQRRYTSYKINNKSKLDINNHNKNEKIKKNFSSSSEEENNHKGYEYGFSPKNNSINKKLLTNKDEIQMKMKIDKITEDKLILNYKNKNETIEVLSDKENIDNYYEYLDLCLETLQDINLKEVPKSKAKINFKFPKEKQNKKIALFDLDETLVHCIGEIKKEEDNNQEFESAHKINVILPSKKETTIAINIRPHLKELLDKIKDVYNIVIFTASHSSYSDAVLNYLDPEDKYFHYRLYRDSCVQYKTNDINFYVKDLDIFKDFYDLKDIIIIDNSILSFAYHLNNGIPVVPFYDSKQDSELPLLCFYLLSIASYRDLREANKEHINLYYFLNQSKKEMSLDEVTMEDNNSINQSNNLIINNLKMNINENKKNVKFSTNNDFNRINSEDNNNQNSKFNEGNERDIKNETKSEKKLIIGTKRNRNNIYRKKFNTVKLESSKIIDFFEKWKNAYLLLALKK